MEGGEDALIRARKLTIDAGRWLSLIGFQVRLGAPTFGPGITTYCDMLDPATSDEQRIRACARMLSAVKRNIEVEVFVAEGRWYQRARLDPYGLEWFMTQEGAVLVAIAAILESAVSAFASAGLEVSPD